MVKGKFQDYLPAKGNSWTYSCLHCRAHLARHDDLISKSFQGSQGRAYLFNQVMNVEYSEAKQRVLLTGIHFVADVFCACCQTMLGWRYERAFEASQRYKEGKVIVELAHLIKDNGWDLDLINPPRRSMSLFSPPSGVSELLVFDCPTIVRSRKHLGMIATNHAVSMPIQFQSSPQQDVSWHSVFPRDDCMGTSKRFVVPGNFSAFPSTSVEPAISTWGPYNKPCVGTRNYVKSDCSLGLDGTSFYTPEEGNSPVGDIDITTTVAPTAAAGPTSSVLLSTESDQITKQPDVQAALESSNRVASSPKAHTSRLCSQVQLSGHKRRRKKRTLFHRRASSSSPSRTSLLPLVSDSETDEEGSSFGRMNGIESRFASPPRLFNTLPYRKSSEGCG